MTKYRDLADLDEDTRIAQIGRTAMTGKRVAFIVEDDGHKADRYIEKLRQNFPGIVVHSRNRGPIAGVVTISVGPPGSGPN